MHARTVALVLVLAGCGSNGPGGSDDSAGEGDHSAADAGTTTGEGHGVAFVVDTMEETDANRTIPATCEEIAACIVATCPLSDIYGDGVVSEDEMEATYACADACGARDMAMRFDAIQEAWGLKWGCIDPG